MNEPICVHPLVPLKCTWHPQMWHFDHKLRVICFNQTTLFKKYSTSSFMWADSNDTAMTMKPLDAHIQSWNVCTWSTHQYIPALLCHMISLCNLVGSSYIIGQADISPFTRPSLNFLGEGLASKIRFTYAGNLHVYLAINCDTCMMCS